MKVRLTLKIFSIISPVGITNDRRFITGFIGGNAAYEYTFGGQITAEL